MIIITAILVALFTFFLEKVHTNRKVRKENQKSECKLTPLPVVPDKPIYQYNSISVRQFGEWYNMKFHHIKKYKRSKK